MSAVRRPCLIERARTAQALRAGGPQEIAAEHVEHRVALVAAVERDGDHDQHQRRQRQVRKAVDDAGRRPRVDAGRDLAGRVEQL